MGTLLVKNGYIVDPDTGFEGNVDIFIKNGVIEKVEQEINCKADRVYNAEGLTVMPGIVDLHVHLRDPGQEYKETLMTATMAAAHGGVTAVLAMPNTRPVMDSEYRTSYVINKARDESCIRVYQAGAITKGMKGEELTNMAALVKSGVPAFSEGGFPDSDSDVFDKLLKEENKACGEADSEK